MATFHTPTVQSMVISFLVEKAIHHQTTTYQELAEFLNETDVYQVPTQGNAMATVLSPILLDVLTWCKERGWPHLTVLVVRKSGQDQGLPGKGFWAALNLSESENISQQGRDLERFKRVEFTAYFTKQVYDYLSL